MRKLTLEHAQEYLQKVYAAWLGKVIGVRFGAPVEGWTYEQIRERYPEMNGYLVDYGIFAADDDTNGPLFFVRTLLDYDTVDADTIGRTFLNYICEYSGFFWWGGVGISSEHTAYENLKKGIPGSLSGSFQYNGKTIAEQIGGQIFSDCWGYVSGYDPLLAKRLASEAAKVTHDGDGIQGAIFVSVAITLAMQRNDIHEVLQETLTYLDRDMEYSRVAQDIIAFYQAEPEDWHTCLNYIIEHYGYDKYPGSCHIIPNMALMIMAMCYGDNDFEKTMIILNQSGWDTDCNCGNVGSIMGALLGLEGIPEKWILPVNDQLNASSCIGSLNIQTVSDSAVLFTKLAYLLKGKDTESVPLFFLPYAHKGIVCQTGNIRTEEGKLCVDSGNIWKYVYYLPADIYDARYDPQFSAIIDPGDRISISIETPKTVYIECYIADCEQNEDSWSFSICGKETMLIDVPKGRNKIINKIGIRADAPYRIIDISIQRKADLEFVFRDYPIDLLGPRYEGDHMHNIRSFVVHSGEWTIAEGLVGKGSEHALISSGNYGNSYQRIEWDFVPIQGKEHLLLFHMQGYMHYSAIGFIDDELVLLRKDDMVRIIDSHPYHWQHGAFYRMTLARQDRQLLLTINDDRFVFPDVVMKDLFGIYLGENGISRTDRLRLY